MFVTTKGTENYVSQDQLTCYNNIALLFHLCPGCQAVIQFINLLLICGSFINLLNVSFSLIV